MGVKALVGSQDQQLIKKELCIMQTVIASEAKQSHNPVIFDEIATSFPSSR